MSKGPAQQVQEMTEVVRQGVTTFATLYKVADGDPTLLQQKMAEVSQSQSQSQTQSPVPSVADTADVRQFSLASSAGKVPAAESVARVTNNR